MYLNFLFTKQYSHILKVSPSKEFPGWTAESVAETEQDPGPRTLPSMTCACLLSVGEL